jgi:hypothetical protein
VLGLLGIQGTQGRRLRSRVPLATQGTRETREALVRRGTLATQVLLEALELPGILDTQETQALPVVTDQPDTLVTLGRPQLLPDLPGIPGIREPRLR